MSKAITILGFLVALAIEWELLEELYLPTVREGVETLGAYMLLTGSVLWFVGLSFLLTERRLKYRICAWLTGISMPILVAAYLLMMRW